MSSEDGSSETSSIASSETSLSSGEYLRSTCKRKPGIKRPIINNNINVSHISGNVAVGTHSAKIVNQTQANGGENSDLPHADSSHSLGQSPFTSTGTFPREEDSEYDRVPEESEYRVAEPIPGSYCLIGYSVLADKKTEWKPRPSKGILVKQGNDASEWLAIQSFFQDPALFIREMDKTADVIKVQKEQFILLTVLLHLERSWGKCSSSNDEVYKNLVKISCSINSGIVVKQALQLLLHVICKDSFRNGNDNVLVVEAIARRSIFSPDGVFREDEHSEQSLKLFVYSRILSLLLIQQAREVELPIVALEQNLKKVHRELKRRCDQIKCQKKGRLRYSMEFILAAISYLLKPHEKSTAATKIKAFIEECQEFCENPEMGKDDLKIFEKLGKKKNGEWIDLHIILIYLHGEVHSERPAPQMETERRAMILIRLIVEAYLQEGGGADWKFCLLASTILADIAKNNVTKEMRKEGGGCLVNFLKDTKVQKRPECRVLLERKCSEVLFCPDRETRTFLVHFLSKNRNLQDTLPADQLIEHLSSTYRTQTLEINKTIISKNASCFVSHGMFQKKKVAVKFLSVKKKHLLENDPKFQARERFIREVYNMERLNATRHPNFPVLLGYDTESLPYHVITEFERWGNLLQFVRKSRERYPPVQKKQLLKMLIDISDALLYLEGLGLVHRAVMADNVLVGDNSVCKLSGLHSLKQLSNGPSEPDSDYCSAELPGFVSTDNDEYLPVRWKAPECLTEHRYSTASDVWAFGVLLYEVLTYGCIPYSHVLDDDEVPFRVVECKEIVPLETCFEHKEYELIKRCCEWSLYRRFKITAVNKRLKEILQDTGKDSAMNEPPPPLEMQQIVYESSVLKDQDVDDLYSSISDLSEDCKSQSIEEDEDLYEEVRYDFVKKTVRGLTTVWEKLSQEDDEYVRNLVALKNPNLASVVKVEYMDSNYWMISQECPNGNLKEHVLNRRCTLGDIVTFLSQVAFALHYLHENHIVHGDLRAEYVNVITPDKVQVGRLGRSKSLSMSAYEFNSTSCVTEAAMSPDSIRRSSPQVILDGHYTHASDVWAFGILAWELYTSFTTGQDRREMSVPYHDLRHHEILPYIRNKGPLDQPEGCPDWVYIIMHQCWAYDSAQRPPFLAIYDCLTSREPMESWMMQMWLRNHDENEWPDLSICQTEDACHVLDADKHPRKQDIEKMCSEDFFCKHSYRYQNAGGYDHDESSPLRESLVVDEGLYSSAYSSCSVRRDEAQLPSKEDASGYLCPAETKSEGNGRVGTKRQTCHQSEMSALNYINIDAVRDKRDQNEISQADHPSRINYAAVRSEVKKTKYNAEYQNVGQGGSFLDQDDYATYDIPAANISVSTRLAECQNVAQKMAQNDCLSCDKSAANMAEDEGENGEYLNKAPKLEEEYFVTYDKPASNVSKDQERNDCSSCDILAANTTEDEGKNGQNGEDRNKAPKMEEDNFITCDKPASNVSKDPERYDGSSCDKPASNVSKDQQKNEDCENKAYNVKQSNCSIQYKPAAINPDDTEKNEEYQNMAAFRQAQQSSCMEKTEGQTAPFSGLPARRRMNESGSQARQLKNWQNENKENLYENTTSAFAHVSQGEHVYANVQSTVETGDSSMEDAHKKEEDLLQEEQTLRTSANDDTRVRRRSLITSLVDPCDDLEFEFYI